MRELCEAEGELCLRRLEHLVERCASFVAEVEAKDAAVQKTMEGWLSRRGLSEMARPLPFGLKK
jgi:hypothetical protein